jgi:hypothetical protein
VPARHAVPVAAPAGLVPSLPLAVA